MQLTLEPLSQSFSVCQVANYSGIDLNQPFCFTGTTDDEKSLVCPTDRVPADALIRDDGWRGFRVSGTLDFSLIGILAKIAALLAERGISIFAVSTYNTDYVLMRADRFEEALSALREGGYAVADML